MRILYGSAWEFGSWAPLGVGYATLAQHELVWQQEVLVADLIVGKAEHALLTMTLLGSTWVLPAVHVLGQLQLGQVARLQGVPDRLAGLESYRFLDCYCVRRAL